MNKIFFTCIFFLCFVFTSGQNLRTIVPDRPVIIGTAFQVQFIIPGSLPVVDISTPAFDSMRVVSGPHYYKGITIVNGLEVPVENITFTLVPLKTGKLRMKGLTIFLKGLPGLRSPDAFVNVSEALQASYNTQSAYTDVSLYAPSSPTDLNDLINKNIFIKVVVDKTICYQGEAVVVSFFLYSRLQATSQATKAPGLYGFSVIDMLPTNKSHQGIEIIQGKIFNTFLLRRMQLFPLQSGILTIDPMYIHNVIEFKDPVHFSTKKVEQDLSSQAVHINVKAIPHNTTSDFTGAVGNFSIAYDLKNADRKDIENKLRIIVQGKGNFIQFGQPLLPQKKGIDFYEQEIVDEINTRTAPVNGKRSFIFNISADTPGLYMLPPVLFTFFDYQKQDFKTVHTDSLKILVKGQPIRRKKNLQPYTKTGNSMDSILPVTFLIILILIASLFIIKGKRSINKTANLDLYDFLKKISAIKTGPGTGKDAYLDIQKIITSLKNSFSPLLDKEYMQELFEIEKECAISVYTPISDHAREKKLKERLLKLLRQMVRSKEIQDHIPNGEFRP